MGKRWKIHIIMCIMFFLIAKLILGCSGGGSGDNITINNTTIIPSITPTTSPTISPIPSPTTSTISPSPVPTQTTSPLPSPSPSPTPSPSSRPTPTNYNSTPDFVVTKGLNWPKNMTNGSILIVNYKEASLAYYTQTGEFLGSFTIPEAFGSIWKNTDGMYIGGSATSKKFYVTDSPDNPWQNYVTNGDQIMDVRSLSNEDRIYFLMLKEVDEQPYYRIEKRKTDGTFISMWDLRNNYINPVALELSTENIYICFRDSDIIQVFDYMGLQTEYIININKPQDIYLWNDYLYVIHHDNSNPAKTYFVIYDTLNQNQKIFEQEIENLTGSSILVLPDGSIVVGSYVEKKIMKFSQN